MRMRAVQSRLFKKKSNFNYYSQVSRVPPTQRRNPGPAQLKRPPEGRLRAAVAPRPDQRGTIPGGRAAGARSPVDRSRTAEVHLDPVNVGENPGRARHMRPT
jgi:hypothetical protein